MLFNQWLILGASLAAVAALSGAYLKGRGDGRAIIIAQQAREDQVRMETLQIAQLAAAEEIAKITFKHTTIRQQAEVITRENVVYRDCVNDPVVSGLLDAARANREAPKSAGGGELPGAGADSTSVLW